MKTKHPAPIEGDSPDSHDKGEKLQKVLATLEPAAIVTAVVDY